MQVDKDIAKALIELAVGIDEPIVKMSELVARIEDDETRNLLKKVIGDLMGMIFAEIIFPIETIYPDLNPDQS